jgi:hypothetical protein
MIAVVSRVAFVFGRFDIGANDLKNGKGNCRNSVAGYV